ncbi:MAG: fumarate reductase subunit D [Thermoplasmata archaeon]
MRPDVGSAVFWQFFALGGFVVALLLPVHIVLFHLGADLGLLVQDLSSFDAMLAWVGDPLVKVYLIVLVGGALFHGAHRFKYVLFDLGLKRAYRPVGNLLYTVAGLTTALTALVAIFAV